MCLAIPVKIKKIIDAQHAEALIHGARILINTAFTPGVKKNDHVLVHAGFSIEMIGEKEAEEVLDLLKSLLDDEKRK